MATWHIHTNERQIVSDMSGKTIWDEYRGPHSNARTRADNTFTMGTLLVATDSALSPRVNRMELRTVPNRRRGQHKQLRVQYRGCRLYSAT